MTRKKMTNAILEKNGGLDSVRALSTAHNILLNHDLKRPVLYHVVITGGDIETYQAVIKKLIRRIRTKCRAEYFGAYEVAENRDGAHAHVFILIETRHNQPFRFLDIREGGYLLKLKEAHGLKYPIHVSKPKNAMHRGQLFAVPVGDELLADCLKWCTYEYKKRSKEGVQRREVYFNSEFKSNVAKRVAEKAKRPTKKEPIPPSAALPADKEEVTIKAVEAASKPLQGDNESSEWVGIKITPEPYQGPFNASQRRCNDKGRNERRTETQYQTNSQGEACEGSSGSRYNASLVGSRSGSNASTEASSGSGKAFSTRYEDGGRASTHRREQGIEVRLTPAQNYLASLYENAVDSGMNLDAMRLYLLEQGVKRTPAQLVDELENTFGFLDYASRHPAPAKLDVKMLDTLIDRTPLKSSRRNVASIGLI